MRVLIVTKLYPNAKKPLAASFNRQQFAALSHLCDVTIVAPLPWFPGARVLSRFTEAGELVGVPRQDERDGMAVFHPRILHLPLIGRPLAGALTTGSLLPILKRHVGRVDVVLGSWAYPHGMTAVALAGLLGLPSVIKVHGTDINVLANMRLLKAQMRWYLPRADRVVVVSRPLGEKVAALGVDPARIDLVRNGVDAQLFHPRDRAACRAKLARSANSRILLYVGWLLDTKGVFDLMDAFARVAAKDPEAELVMIGDGPARAQLERRQKEIPRVTLTGALPPDAVATWLGACDVFTLPSWSEGTPNVVLEALAAGRRVVATDVGGIPDLIPSAEVGTLVPVRSPDALADALTRALATQYDPARVVELGSPGSWQDSARALHASLEHALRSR